MDKEEARAYRERWAAVAEIEEREMREATIETRWRRFNSLLEMAALLNLKAERNEDEISEVRARWQRLRAALLS
jgi:predicted nuclease with TOPRIM domain